MAANLLMGKEVAEKIKEGVRQEIATMKERSFVPKLVAVQVGENASSQVYLNAQKKNCTAVGIDHEVIQLPADVTEQGLIDRLMEMNSNTSITGIILQMPLPAGFNTRKIQSVLNPLKDVEGMNPANMGWIVYGRSTLAPCTALAVKALIEHTGVDLYGKEVVMVGHSEIVGKPVGLFLVDKFATVSICHIGTSKAGHLEEHVRRAEILVVAVGKANLIPGSWVREGAIVIDVGINRVGDKIVGDVEFEAAKERAGWITPVPGGVGPVTNAILLRNVTEAAKLQG